MRRSEGASKAKAAPATSTQTAAISTTQQKSESEQQQAETETASAAPAKAKTGRLAEAAGLCGPPSKQADHHHAFAQRRGAHRALQRLDGRFGAWR